MQPQPTSKPKWLRWLPLLIIAIGIGLSIYFKWYEYLSFDELKRHSDQMQLWVSQHPLLTALAFMGIYTVAVALSFPGATILTLAGGFLFGRWWGTLIVVVAATVGAMILFLAVKTSLGEALANKAKGWLVKLETGFQKNAFSYLLFLRLLPVFPFWVINIVPALLNIRLRTFVITTFLGIIPGSFVYVALGDGLGQIFQNNAEPNLGIIFQPNLLLPIVGLAILSIIPIIYNASNKNAFKKKREPTHEHRY